MRRLLQNWSESSIILTSKERSVWRNKKPKKRPFLSRKTDRFPDIRVLPGHWSQWFWRELCRPIYHCSSKRWYSGIRFKVGRNFYCLWRKSHLMTSWKDCTNLRTRESEKLETVLELYNMEIQKKARPDCHRLKTMVKRSSEQDLRNRNFSSQKRKLWRNAVLKNQVTKQREKRTLGDCWQWKTNGQCSKENNCSFRHDINERAKFTQPNSVSEFFHAAAWEKMRREPEVPEASVPAVECLDGPARITSKELAPIQNVKSGILQNACSSSPKMDADLGKSVLMHTAKLKNRPAKGTKRWWQKCSGHVEEAWAIWLNGETRCIRLIKYTTVGLRIPGYGAAKVFNDFTEELRHTETDPMCKIHESRCTSHQNSRPKSFARIYLPRWTSSA